MSLIQAIIYLNNLSNTFSCFTFSSVLLHLGQLAGGICSGVITSLLGAKTLLQPHWLHTNFRGGGLIMAYLCFSVIIYLASLAYLSVLIGRLIKTV